MPYVHSRGGYGWIWVTMGDCGWS